ncbi:protein FAN-like [Ylistrum balloti]|uniref:protein FAN-like n=1 Tax=Ylistrum balloti TaxID=509963 RepID=UPI002905F3FC|nr:protein FAN-like [Ylistrum balloti]
MTFIETDTAAQERFNLLLLEPGEIYFEDFSVFFYPRNLSEDEAIKRKQRGHLKICSKSIVFVPKESQHPILKFPLKHVKEINEWSGGLFSRMDMNDRMVKIKTDQVIAMKEKNIIAPYIFHKESVELRFSLNYVTADDCLPQMCQLHRASTLPPADQSAMINAIVLSRRSRVSFNTSWLDDLYEKILMEAQGDKISPLVTNPGRIMLTSSRLYFQPFNNIESVPVIKIRLKDLKRVIKRRFLLKQLGIEIFCQENSSCPHLYLSLKTADERNELYAHIMQQKDVKLEDTGQEDMTLRWQNGDISNFDYLIYLNSVADRSFSDLTQYPVMPWVIQDYTSSHLDLSNPMTFRDLSKPIGALNEERISKMRERYAEMPEPKFLYGSHYSTPGYVLFYLALIAPEYVLCLQNGKFDQPDRMFNSVYETWQNCMMGAADFKELIPEFYSLGSPEFLLNNGLSNFGIRQDGRPVGNVELPSWAEGPEDFLRKLREALECEHVSTHLHEWIDLIFGYKQRGYEAEKADNVFYFMTYEGSVDLDSIPDPNERARMEIQIMEFGQVPKQVFNTPHPQRFTSPPPRSGSSRTSSTNEGTVPVTSDSISMPTTLKVSEEDKTASTSDVSLTDLASLQLYHKYTLHKDGVSDVKLSSDGKNIFSVSQDSLLKMYSLEDQRQLRSINISTMALSSCQLMPDDKTIIVGSWDNNVYFYSIEFGRVLDTLCAHDDAVSNILWSSNKLLTASWDSTVKIWKFIPPSASTPFTVAEYAGQLDHDAGVNCQSTDEGLSLLVTGTIEGHINVWSISSGYQIASLEVHNGKVNDVTLSPDCRRILSCGDDNILRVLDLETGTEILVRHLQTQCMCFKWIGGLLLTGEASGSIQLWDMDKGQIISTLPAHTDAVTCLDLKNKSLLMAGQDKTVSMWKIQQ